MRYNPTDPQAFAHRVRYQDAVLASWRERTGRGNSYKPEEVPEFIDVPTNADRSRAECILFVSRPLKFGESYLAYLTIGEPGSKGQISTWTGEKLATVIRITSYNAVCFGRDAGFKGSFWALGIDGRLYYGRHNGRGMYCRMRLARWADEYDTQMKGAEGWETVTSSPTFAGARQDLKDYTTNAPEFTYRIKRRKVRQE